MSVVCNPIMMGRWCELMVVCVWNSDEVTREADANNSSGELGLLLFAFQSMFIPIWVSRLEIAEFPDSIRRSAP